MNAVLTERLRRVSQIEQWFLEDPLLAEFVLGMMSTPVPVVQPPAPIALAAKPEPKPVEPTPIDKGGYTRPNLGFQARVLRYLFTGNSTCPQLATVMGLKASICRDQLHNLRDRNYISVNGEDVTLTEEGRKVAEWFVAHPDHVRLPSGLFPIMTNKQ